VVSSLNISDVAEILYMRTLLEGAAAELAAGHATERELMLLERLADEVYQVGDPVSYTRFVSTNREYHLAIARASGNRRLERAIGGLLDDMQRVITATVSLSYRMNEMQRDHRSIVHALRQRQPDAARRMVETHMRSSRDRIGEALRLPGARS